MTPASQMSYKNRKQNYPLYQTTYLYDFRTMVERIANEMPDRTAFSFRLNPKDKDYVSRTFNQVRERVRYIGTELQSRKIPDQFCALLGEASYDWFCSFMALMASGAVTVPADKDLPDSDIVGIVNRAECSYVFYSPAIEKKIDSIRDQIPTVKTYVCLGHTDAEWAITLDSIADAGEKKYAAGDRSYYEYEQDVTKLASLVFTSGTTGKGKGVMLSQKNILNNMMMGMYNFEVNEKTLFLLPPHHTFGSTVNLIGLFSQGVEIYISSGIRYMLNELKEQQPTFLILVPLFVETMYKRIWETAEKQKKDKTLRTAMKLARGLNKIGIDASGKLFKSVTDAFGGKLKMIICGGAALSQDIIDDFETFGIVIMNGYGISECSPLVTANRNEYRKPGSVGCPILGTQLKIANPDENGEGEICVRGDSVMLGYFKDPEATKAAFDDEGFFKTGDWGRLDDEGWLYITGRIKNIIILSNGKNVYPEEIEFAIQAIPGVNEVVVYEGESKEQKTDLIVAEIYPDAETLERHGITDPQKYFEDEIKKINDRSAPYKKVSVVKLRSEEFEKNTSRKILRFKINKKID